MSQVIDFQKKIVATIPNFRGIDIPPSCTTCLYNEGGVCFKYGVVCEPYNICDDYREE